MVQTQWSCFALLLRHLKVGCILGSLTCINGNERGVHIQAARSHFLCSGGVNLTSSVKNTASFQHNTHRLYLIPYSN